MVRYCWAWALALGLLFGGCALLKKKQEEQVYEPTRPVPRFTGEPLVSADCKPPPGYNPVWFRGVRPMDSLGAGAFLNVSRIDPRPDSLGVFVQVMDSSGWYYTGAAERKWDNVWCMVVDSVDGVRADTVWRMSLRELTAKNQEPMALYIVMDYSGSMGDERCDRVQEAVRNLIKQKREKDAYGLIRFDDRVIHELSYTTDPARLLQKLNTRGMGSYAGGTAINDAVFEALKQLRRIREREYRRKAVILFSDGTDNASVHLQDTVIYEARLNHIPVSTIDFGDSVVPGFLERYARHTGGSYHHIYGTFEFNDVFQDIYTRMLHSYYMTFASREAGLHRVSLKLCLPKGTAEGHGWCDNTPRTDHEWAMYALSQRRLAEEPPRPVIPGQLPRYTVYFDFNIAAPRDDSQPTVVEASRYMAQYPALRARVLGHTDFTGSDDFNRELSTARCQQVRELLIASGVAAERVEVQAWGEDQPVADNHTKRGRARNRRVEIILLPPPDAP